MREGKKGREKGKGKREGTNSDPWGCFGAELGSFLCFMSTLKFPILKILKQMRSTNPYALIGAPINIQVSSVPKV